MPVRGPRWLLPQGELGRELKAIDADPLRIAGLKTDENAKPCNDRVVWND